MSVISWRGMTITSVPNTHSLIFDGHYVMPIWERGVDLQPNLIQTLQ